MRVSNASGCFNVSDEETFAFTGIDEDVSPDFTVYPVPADETVTFAHKAGEDVQVELLDLAGKSLGTFFDNGNIEIDLHPFSSGIYFLRCTGDGGEYVVRKIVKR